MKAPPEDSAHRPKSNETHETTIPNRAMVRAFQVSMWIVVISSLGALVAKVAFGKTVATPTFSFLLLIVVAALLATSGTDLIVFVALKIQKLKVGGIEVELAVARREAEDLKVEDVANFEESLDNPDVPQDNPFPSRILTGPEKYQYEKLSHRLYRLCDDIKDPNKLDLKSRENYRNLLLYVGKAAHSMQHYTKSLEILQRLKDFAGRDLDHDELRLLGTAYLWAADEQTDKLHARRLRNSAVPLLRLATRKHPVMAVSAYNLGWAYLSLEKYDPGIRQMQRCLKVDQRYEPWLNWNIACGLTRLGKLTEALDVLRSIRPGGLWNDIEKDPWFTEVERPDFSQEFRKICSEKISEYNGKKREKEIWEEILRKLARKHDISM